MARLSTSLRSIADLDDNELVLALRDRYGIDGSDAIVTGLRKVLRGIAREAEDWEKFNGRYKRPVVVTSGKRQQKKPKPRSDARCYETRTTHREDATEQGKPRD